MIQTLLIVLNLYELVLLIAAIIGVAYDSRRNTFRSGTSVPDF